MGKGPTMFLRLRSTCFLVFVLVAALLVAACGGGDGKAEFESGLARVQAHLDDATAASADVAGSTDANARARGISASHEHLVKAADIAADLDPPEDARDAHDQLTSALRDYADVFRRIAAASGSDPNETTKLYSEAGEVYARLQAANEALKDAGYQVPSSDSGEAGD